MAIITPAYIGEQSIGSDRIIDGSIEEHDLADTINISKFVNDVVYLPVVLNNPQDGESIVFDAALGYWTNKLVTGGATDEDLVMVIVNTNNLLDGGLSNSTYTYTADGGTSTSTYTNIINGGTA